MVEMNVLTSVYLKSTRRPFVHIARMSISDDWLGDEATAWLLLGYSFARSCFAPFPRCTHDFVFVFSCRQRVRVRVRICVDGNMLVDDLISVSLWPFKKPP